MCKACLEEHMESWQTAETPDYRECDCTDTDTDKDTDIHRCD